MNAASGAVADRGVIEMSEHQLLRRWSGVEDVHGLRRRPGLADPLLSARRRAGRPFHLQFVGDRRAVADRHPLEGAARSRYCSVSG